MLCSRRQLCVLSLFLAAGNLFFVLDLSVEPAQVGSLSNFRGLCVTLFIVGVHEHVYYGVLTHCLYQRAVKRWVPSQISEWRQTLVPSKVHGKAAQQAHDLKVAGDGADTNSVISVGAPVGKVQPNHDAVTMVPAVRHGSPESSDEEISAATNGVGPKSAIILLYRDREAHYRTFMENWMRRPKSVREESVIFNIVQDNGYYFRRGWLADIGIKIVMAEYPGVRCIVKNDIDMLPDLTVNYSMCNLPTQLSSKIECYKWGVPYHQSAGGVIAASPAHWKLMNGISARDMHGWGGEDDDLFQRVHKNGLTVGQTPSSQIMNRPEGDSGRYFCGNESEHTERVKTNNGKMIKQIMRLRQGSTEWKVDGLNSIRFVEARERRVDEYGTTWVYADEELLVPMRRVKVLTSATFFRNPSARLVTVTCYSGMKFDMFTHDPTACTEVSKSLHDTGGWMCKVGAAVIDAMREGGIRKGSHFLDIGAHIGVLSLPVAHSGYPVVAIEPLTMNADLFAASLGTYPPKAEVQLIRRAILDVNSTECASNPQSLEEESPNSTDVGNGRLDNVCGPLDEHVRAIGIDALLATANLHTACFPVVHVGMSGKELLGLQTAAGILDGPCPPRLIICEYDTRFERRWHPRIKDARGALAYLEGKGYVCSQLEGVFQACRMKNVDSSNVTTVVPTASKNA